MRDDCELCQLCQGDVKTHLWYEDEDWIIVDCVTCNIPMIVYKQHIQNLPEGKTQAAKTMMTKAFGEGTFRSPRKILEHFHLHFIKTES